MRGATAVRERPILMSGPMVRAILDGRKTQTRRVAMVRSCGVLVPALGFDPAPAVARCPFGTPGDRLWVREAWSAQYDFPTEYRGSRMAWYHDTPPAWRLPSNALRTYYRADRTMYDVCDLGEPLGIDLVRHRSHGEAPRWTPGIHMPRWASRLTLEVTGVRVERLCDIGEADAEAEGSFAVSEVLKQDAARQAAADGRGDCGGRDYFRALWDSLNAARGYGWDANPWVWAITFRPVAALAATEAPR